MRDVLNLAEKELGTWEWAGKEHNPRVLQYFKDVGHGQVKDDETAWCAAFVGSMLKRAGYPHTGKLTARSYLNLGEPVRWQDAKPGDVAVNKRGTSSWQGHVYFVVEVDIPGKRILGRGGNQSNQVNDKWHSVDGRNSLLGVRRIAPLVVEPNVDRPEHETDEDFISKLALIVEGLPSGMPRDQATAKLYELAFWISQGKESR